MSQILDTDGTRPGLGTRLTVHAAVAAARLLAHLPPRRIRAVLGLARRGARPARFAEALRARREVTAVSTLCAGRYCLPRSLATALLCRMRGHWPTWCSGVRTSPFGAHAWVEAEGRPVDEPQDIATYLPMVTVPDTPANHAPDPGK
ncbi:lasso peptide biosynthesis B2 protein [Streptomyces coeruleoprunus]|uniref:Lasso peptide biosynthesis B2 protein n=1 Tax=Streptomyces coeruleoprunus TaxID=285563 RepID=A0ABV9XC43_9ACTN